VSLQRCINISRQTLPQNTSTRFVDLNFFIACSTTKNDAKLAADRTGRHRHSLSVFNHAKKESDSISSSIGGNDEVSIRRLVVDCTFDDIKP
jgi:hypothetical protein